jgi:hypothetical protein
MPRRSGLVLLPYALECRMPWRLEDPERGPIGTMRVPVFRLGSRWDHLRMFTGCILLEICAKRKKLMAGERVERQLRGS